MGSVGDAYDNAMCESFFATLEGELLSRASFDAWVDETDRCPAEPVCLSDRFVPCATSRATPQSAGMLLPGGRA